MTSCATCTRRRGVTGVLQDRVRVRALPDRISTGVDPTPLEPPSEPLSGDSDEHLIAPLLAFAESLGYSVSFEEIAGSAGGWCDARARRLVIDAHAPTNARVRTLIHECAHALGVDCERYSGARAEVIVDTVTFVVCAGAGRAVDGESVPTSPAGVRTARSRRSASSPRRSTRSHDESRMRCFPR
jgi:hypothetical protein